jgi:hypothetical protein
MVLHLNHIISTNSSGARSCGGDWWSTPLYVAGLGVRKQYSCGDCGVTPRSPVSCTSQHVIVEFGNKLPGRIWTYPAKNNYHNEQAQCVTTPSFTRAASTLSVSSFQHQQHCNCIHPSCRASLDILHCRCDVQSFPLRALFVMAMSLTYTKK